MVRLEHLDLEGRRVALVTMDRREKRNALTPDMLANITDAARRVHDEQAKHESAPRALVLVGEGPMFSSGFDLSLCRDDALAMADLLTRLSRAVRALRRLPIPVVAAAHGGAIAGGCALLSGADVVVTDDAAQLGYPVVRLGVSPAVNAFLLGLTIGRGRTRERTLDPALIDGREAVRVGLAHESVPSSADVRPRALEIAAALASKPPHAMAVTKRWLNELEGSDRDDTLDAALQVSLSLAGGEEEQARLTALWKS